MRGNTTFSRFETHIEIEPAFGNRHNITPYLHFFFVSFSVFKNSAVMPIIILHYFSIATVRPVRIKSDCVFAFSLLEVVFF